MLYGCDKPNHDVDLADELNDAAANEGRDAGDDDCYDYDWMLKTTMMMLMILMLVRCL